MTLGSFWHILHETQVAWLAHRHCICMHGYNMLCHRGWKALNIACCSHSKSVLTSGGVIQLYKTILCVMIYTWGLSLCICSMMLFYLYHKKHFFLYQKKIYTTIILQSGYFWLFCCNSHIRVIISTTKHVCWVHSTYVALHQLLRKTQSLLSFILVHCWLHQGCLLIYFTYHWRSIPRGNGKRKRCIYIAIEETR